MLAGMKLMLSYTMEDLVAMGTRTARRCSLANLPLRPAFPRHKGVVRMPLKDCTRNTTSRACVSPGLNAQPPNVLPTNATRVPCAARHLSIWAD